MRTTHLSVHYGEKEAVKAVSIDVREHEGLALMARRGAASPLSFARSTV
jgi:hypothetical protein